VLRWQKPKSCPLSGQSPQQKLSLTLRQCTHAKNFDQKPALPEQDEDKVSGGFVSTALQWLT